MIADANGDLFGHRGTAAPAATVRYSRSSIAAHFLPRATRAPPQSWPLKVGNGLAYGGLIADANGDLFGTTEGGGANDDGAVFEIVNNGTLAAPSYASTPTTLASFYGGGNGSHPHGGLIADANGDLFGTTESGGAGGDGTVFEIVNNGTLSAPSYASTPTILASFNGSNGQVPLGSLIADANGDLFGTTSAGGTGNYYSDGTVFEIAKTASGYAGVTTLVSFNALTYNNGWYYQYGASPMGSLIADANGDLFGTTESGGAYGYGTIFEIVNNGTLSAPSYASTPTDLVSFNGSNGAYPYGSLIADANGDLFATTEEGGTYGLGAVFEITNSGFVVGAPPTIIGTIGGQSTTVEASVTPFKSVTIGDSNAGATDTLTITVGGAGGALMDGSGFSGLTNEGNGVYSLSGSASAITNDLDALVFTPNAAWPKASATTTFTLSDVSSAGGAPAVDSTTTVTDNDPSGAISVSAAYLAANIDGINAASQVSSITLTDSGIPQLDLTDEQATTDTAALNKITNEVFELLAPGMAPTYYVGGNGATGSSLSLTASNSTVVERANSNVALTHGVERFRDDGRGLQPHRHGLERRNRGNDRGRDRDRLGHGRHNQRLGLHRRRRHRDGACGRRQRPLRGAGSGQQLGRERHGSDQLERGPHRVEQFRVDGRGLEPERCRLERCNFRHDGGRDHDQLRHGRHDQRLGLHRRRRQRDGACGRRQRPLRGAGSGQRLGRERHGSGQLERGPHRVERFRVDGRGLEPERCGLERRDFRHDGGRDHDQLRHGRHDQRLGLHCRRQRGHGSVCVGHGLEQRVRRARQL